MKAWDGRSPKVGHFPQPSEVKLWANRAVVCCIYHKPKGVDESSDESSSSSSDSDEDEDEDTGAGRRQRAGGKGKGKGKRHDCGHDHGEKGTGRDDGSRRRRRDVSPNAYEKMPRYKPKDGDAGGGGHTGGGTGPQAQR
jgi:protein phosphatase 1 regulatory subunit 11